MPRGSSEPVSTYDQAIWRLAQYSLSDEYQLDESAICVLMVADIFWVRPLSVVRDVRAAVRSVSAPPVFAKRWGRT